MVYRPANRIWTAPAPSSALMPLVDIKDHLRVSHDDEDVYIAAIVAAAVATVEKTTQRLLTARTITLSLPGLPTGQEPVELPGGFVSALTSVTVDGVPKTGCTVIGHSPALLIPSTDWPAVTGENYPVTVIYTAGYSAPPVDLIHAVKLIAAEMYQTRETAIMGSTSPAVVSAEYLMAPHRIWPA